MHPPGGSAGPGLGPAVPDVSATSPPPPLAPRHHTLKRGTRAFAKAGVREEKPTSCKKNHVFSMKSSTAIPESVAHSPSAPGSSSSLSPPHTHPGGLLACHPHSHPTLEYPHHGRPGNKETKREKAHVQTRRASLLKWVTTQDGQSLRKLKMFCRIDLCNKDQHVCWREHDSENKKIKSIYPFKSPLK